jgi:hypothetical protein
LRTALPIALGLVALAAVVLVVAGVFGGGSDKPAANQIETPTTQTATSPGGVDRTATVVAVLNGTTVEGLARGLARAIEDGGFRLGTVDNALDQTRAQTSIEYAAGGQDAAKEVARLIKAQDDVIVPMTDATRVLAAGSQVVVTVGSDQSPAG